MIHRVEKRYEILGKLGIKGEFVMKVRMKINSSDGYINFWDTDRHPRGEDGLLLFYYSINISKKYWTGMYSKTKIKRLERW